MKQYHTIPQWKNGHFGKRCLAFDKPDGSNMRFEWSRKRCKKGDSDGGWYKSGTRKQMIDSSHEFFGNGVKIFQEKYGESLAKVFYTKQYREVQSFVVFGEYLGANSFAGQHDDADEDMDVVLFDVNQYKKGTIDPFEFVKNFGHLHIPEVVHRGNYNKQLVYDVQNGLYDVDEGVVVKGVDDRGKIWMCKIKTRTWLELIQLKMQGKLHLFKDDIAGFTDE